MKPFLIALLLSALVGGSQASDCGTPPDLENATYTASGYAIGNWAFYTCNKGYILYGRNRILCTKNGWNKPSLFCQKIKCDHPPPINNGTVTEGEEWTYGAEASFSCDEGHTLTGQETIHCTDIGTWSHPPPNCTASDCGPPPDMENGNYTASGYTIGNWAFYTCNKGYILYGRNRILCTKNGWTKPSLCCQKIECDHPPTISNGRVTEEEEWTYGAEAIYSCDKGYTLTGQETIHCTDTGAWSYPPPNCTANDCGPPPDLENATYTVSVNTIGNWAFYTCNKGYILYGRNRIRCTKNGWSKPSLFCLKIECDHPPTISNGRVTEEEEWTYGAEAIYSCDKGYTLTGQETIHCTDTGAWSYPLPVCTANDCGTPPDLENATYIVSDNTIGKCAFYTCNKGYILYGRNRIRCTKNGWSKPSFCCQKINCDQPPPINNGRVTEGVEWPYGAEASYSCNVGHILTGQETIHCTDTGAWSHPPPICTASDCGPPPDLENANCDASGYTIGNWAFYTCNKGYILHGRNRILCTRKGWSKTTMSCQKIECDHPPTINNGRVTEGEEWTYGAEANYSCDEGHTLTGQETIYCTDTGTWSHPPPVCTGTLVVYNAAFQKTVALMGFLVGQLRLTQGEVFQIVFCHVSIAVTRELLAKSPACP
ncbi:sushi, von Willebrand factor type A, EGF and pentraxin domain-containing protein 1-like isoform X2 [Hypanus sabinus]|uniref:sushi, von Willebrand factor type A, EGF and pentraxin domain-containing protein 1-like isoform X2 n=1 Tax=Hypanus sabinus TaxID=79690 RepID=UPI0028C4DB3D|nr:sushi, von Willebrand factor type A, EGF and pentraxin domain-containing protein 1-like isoform X2 [Hypanus sabinus]